MKFKLVEKLTDSDFYSNFNYVDNISKDSLDNMDVPQNDEFLTEGLYKSLNDIALLMPANGYSNIVVDNINNKIVADKLGKTYLFEVIFGNVTSRQNNRFHVNYADSVNKDKKVYLQHTTPVGASVGKAGIGHNRHENRRQYVDKIFIWELKYLADATDPTTWP